MNWFNLIFIGIGLAMDAVAVSICKGLATGKVSLRHSVTAGAYFGGFQALMPLIGYLLGCTFAHLIDRWDHWISFVLLALIGANMIRESFGKEEENASASFSFQIMLPLAVATSIDALAVGVSFSFSMRWEELAVAVLVIGIITFLLSAIAVKVGGIAGDRYKQSAERLGGVILILIGIKILLEGLA